MHTSSKNVVNQPFDFAQYFSLGIQIKVTQNYQIMFDYLDKETQENLYYYLHVSIHI